jgi:hypothetical protein
MTTEPLVVVPNPAPRPQTPQPPVFNTPTTELEILLNP